MNMTQRIGWVLVAILSGSVSTVAQDSDVFRYSRSIEIAGDTPDELFTVSLDSDVYAATRDGFPDVRIFDEAHRLVPFLIRPASESKSREIRNSWSAVSPALKPLEENGMEIRIALAKDDPSPGGLRFVTPLKNFEQQVRVFVTVDGAETLLVDGALIFDYSQFMDVRRTDVDLPVTAAREFRIVVEKLTSEQESQLLELSRSLKEGTEEGRTEKVTVERRPFRIDRIEFWHEKVEEVAGSKVVQPYALTDFKVTQEPDDKQTLVEFTSRREPLTAIKVVTDSRNFSRRVEVQIDVDSSAVSKWNTIAEGTISQFQLQGLLEERVTIGLPETRHDHYRVVIKNGDSPELAITGIEAEGLQYQIVFLKQPGQTVQLSYGSDSAEAPQQDDIALKTALTRKMSPATAKLGVQPTMQAVAEKPIDAKTLVNNPFVLGSIIAVLLAALGWGLYQASRRIDQMPNEDKG